MKFSELQAAFVAKTGVVGEIDDADMAIWFNEAQLDLALDFGRVKTVELVPDENGIVTKPEDSIKIIDATGDYKWDAAGQMIFGTTEPVRVTYRAMPDPAHVLTGAAPDQTPDLPPVLHGLLATYAAAMYWYRESEGDTEEMNLADKYKADYERAKRSFMNKMDTAGSRVDRWIIE